MNNIELMTNYFLGKMRRLFFMAYPESENDYKKSRNYYIVGDTAAQTIAQLSGGTFLVALMEVLGISDGNMGIISSFATFAGLTQLLSIKLSAILTKNKLFVCVTALQKLWLSFIFFIPLLNLSTTAARILMIVCYCFVQVCAQLGSPATVDWIANLVPAKLRGSYFALKDSIAVFFMVSVMLVMGIVVDKMKQTNINQALVLLGIIIAILGVINVMAFAKMKEPKMACLTPEGLEMMGGLAKKSVPFANRHKDIKFIPEIQEAFRTQKFRKLLNFNCLWTTAFYISSPFNSSFQIKDLQLPYTYIMIMTFATNMLRVALSPKAGKIADKIGITKVLSWAYMSMAGYFLIMALSTVNNAYITCIFSYTASSLGWVFIGIGMLAIQLEFLKEEKRIVQYSLLCVLSGLYGFLVSVVGGKLVDFLQVNPITIGGYTLFAQQFTNVIGFLFVIGTIIYLKKKVEPLMLQSEQQ